MRFVSVLVLSCLLVSTSFAADKPAAKVAPKAAAKVEASDDTAVEEMATKSKTHNVAVKEMPANSSGEMAVRVVNVPEDLGNFRRTEKPAVKDVLPSLPTPGLFGGLALAGIGWMIFEAVKFAALAFAVVWGIRHLFPNLALRADTTTAKLRQATGVKQIGGVGETVKQFDTAVAELRKKHRAHSGLASFMETRLSQFAAPVAPPTKKKVKKATNVVKTS